MAHKIDHIDRAIVRLLQQDGRMSSAEIARRVGNITERTVRYRIDRLTEGGFIRIRAIVNPSAVGYPVLGDISLEVEPGRVRELARKIAEFDCVAYVAFSMGQRDISLQIFARSNDELFTFATETLGKLPGISKTTTLVVPLKLKDVDEWQIPSASCTGNGEGEG